MSTAPPETLAVGRQLSLTVERIAQGGDAVCTAPDGRVVFVDGGFVGDAVTAEITEVKPRFARARILSGLPIDTACPVAAQCGGCRFWGADYADELAWKVGAARDAVARLARDVEWPEPTVVPSDDITGYRWRARLRFDADGATGFLARGSDVVVAGAPCAVLHPDLDAARPMLQAFVRDVPGVQSVFLEWDAERRGAAATYEVDDAAYVEVIRAVRARMERAPNLMVLSTVVVRAGRNRTSVLGDGDVWRRRACGATEAIVKEPTESFSQAHAAANERLVGSVVDAARALAPPLEGGAAPAVLELFSGSGNFTFGLLGAGFDVDAVEGAAGPVHAAANAWKAMEDRPPRRARFHVGDLTHRLPAEVFEALGSYDVLVVDPPRGGLTKAMVRALAAGFRGKGIVYVSCDPPALARDAGRLARGGWHLGGSSAWDLYPRTPHIEVVATFGASRG